MPRLLLALGLLLVVVALTWMAFPRALAWFGHLPGDVRVPLRGGVLFVPVTSMLLASLVGTVALNLLAWLLRRLG